MMNKIIVGLLLIFFSMHSYSEEGTTALYCEWEDILPISIDMQLEPLSEYFIESDILNKSKPNNLVDSHDGYDISSSVNSEYVTCDIAVAPKSIVYW